jgi:prepilin-type N-terminal cleavage/methylation domain-containing protein
MGTMYTPVRRHQAGFTIVELIVVISIVAVLAAIGVLGYGAWRDSLVVSAVKSDLQAAVSAMEDAGSFDEDGYPEDVGSVFTPSDGVQVSGGSSDGETFCIDGTSTSNPSITYYIDSESSETGPQEGTCATRPIPPAMPSGLTVATKSYEQINLSWSPAVGALSYNLQCATNTIFSSGLQETNVTGTTGSVTGLSPDTLYHCRIQSVNATGSSSWSTAIAEKTLGWSIIAPGYTSNCAVSDNTIYCWGNNTNGQLGNGNTTATNIPTPVTTSTGLAGKTITDLSVGQDFACAVASGRVYCWGLGTGGQLGNSATSSSSTPVAVSTSGVLSGKTITSVSAGGYHACAVSSQGKAYCWGGGALFNGALTMGNGSTGTFATSSPVAVADTGALSGKSVTQISAGWYRVCAVASGGAYCWGQGYLGDGTTSDSSVPVAVSTAGVLAGKTITNIGSGQGHSCAVGSGEVFCWGSNSEGQLGNSSLTASTIPVAVNTAGVLSGKTMTSVSANYFHSCALASDDRVYCWGYGTFGDLGNGSTAQQTTPVAVSTAGVLAGKDVSLLGESYYQTNCALAESRIYCWGYGGYGLLGNRGTSNQTLPVNFVDP